MLNSLFTSILAGTICGLCYAYFFTNSQRWAALKTTTSAPQPLEKKIIVFSVILFFIRYALLAATIIFLVYILHIQPFLFLLIFLSSFLGAVYLTKG